MHAQILLYDGFDELDVVAPYEVLQVAAAVGAPGRVARGVRAEVARGVIPAAVAEGHHAGATVAAVCTGAILLAAAGLLRGRGRAASRGSRDR